MRKIRSDKGTKRASSGVEFDEPTEKGNSTPMGREGLGHFYANLGMNKWEVNKRMKAHGMDKQLVGNRRASDDVSDSFGVQRINNHQHPTIHNLSPVEGAE